MFLTTLECSHCWGPPRTANVECKTCGAPTCAPCERFVCVLAKKIVVNGRVQLTGAVDLSFGEVVARAGMSGTPSVMCSYADPAKAARTLAPGDSVEVKSGMVFNVFHTGNA